MVNPDFAKYTTLTFDFYGTLVDWEHSLLGPLRSIVDRAGASPSNAEISAHFTTLDSDPVTRDFRSYGDVLALLTRAFAQDHGVTATDGDVDAVIQAVEKAPPYVETLEVLSRWAADFQLVVVSNTDDDIIAKTLEQFPFRFDDVVTSEQVGAYKPDANIFRLLRERVAVPGESILHVAEWLAEVIPARALGMGTVWVERTAWAHVGGTDPPDLKVHSLRELDAIMYAAGQNRALE